MESAMNYTVYWYRRPVHTDPYTEGYIGITNDMERRNLEHLRSKSITHFTNALSKYDDISYTILHLVTTPEEALALEYTYRPDINIGWNTAIGGEDTLKSVRETPISLYHKDNYVQLLTFPSLTKAAKAIGCTIGRLAQAKVRQSTDYGLDGWAVLHFPMFDRSLSRPTSEVKSTSVKGTKRSKPSPFKGVTNRWTEEQKQAISKVHKGKTIPKEQIEKLREHNRHSSKCVAISIKHIETPTNIQYFHSISEASRATGIPLSRLKSKAQRPINKYGKDGWAIHSLGSE